MEHFPILQELTESDSAVFAVIGIIIASAVSYKLRKPKKCLYAALLCAAAYIICEITVNITQSYLAELIALFIGTASIGGAFGALISSAVLAVRSKKCEKNLHSEQRKRAGVR